MTNVDAQMNTIATTTGSPGVSRRTIEDWLKVVLRTPITRRAWAEAGYAIVALPLAIAGFFFLVVSSAFGIVLLVTLLGLPVLALSGLASRRLGAVHRKLAWGMLRERVTPPAPFVPGQGILGWLQSALRDPASWRARAYLLMKLPLALATVWIVAMWVQGLFWVSYPFWWQATGASDPLPSMPFDRDTWAHALVVVVAGVAVLLAGPWVIHALVWIDRRLIHALLGRPAGAERVRELEDARARIVDDAAATMRRIERDLHDGTQAQLGTLAMNLGQAKEKLEHHEGVPYDPAGALDLVEAAHRHAKEALVELRDIARGIHPPALDLGLEAALATLVARSAVPATLHADLPERPGRAIETIAYFSAAELLANAARHGYAQRVEVDVIESAGVLRLTVRDDGIGGATPGAGSGLIGLADRLRAVDGRLDIVSPAGGPTVISVELPLHT
jgi:signal transduction histidine kinase